MKTRLVKCDLCGSDDYAIIWDKEAREKVGLLVGKLIKHEGKIIHGTNVVCKKCGLVYIKEQMTPETLNEFYKNEYRKIYDDNHNSTQRHCSNAFLLFMEIYKGFKVKNLLDIGCFKGDFVNKLRDKTEIDVKGIDFDTYGGKNVIQGDFMTYNFSEKFECVTLFNSLEHMLSPTETLQRIYDLMVDDGILMISVPNLINNTLKVLPDGFLSNAHTYTFSSYTLEKLLLKTGFVPMGTQNTVESIGTKLYVFAQKKKPVDVIYNDKIESETYRMYFVAMDCFMKCLLNIQGGHKNP